MAEYIILRRLELADSPMSFDSLQKEVYNLSKRVKEDGESFPLYFTYRNGEDSLESDTFISALSRCRSARSVYKSDGKFYLSEGGQSFISNADKYEIPTSFVESVDEALTDDQAVELIGD